MTTEQLLKEAILRYPIGCRVSNYNLGKNCEFVIIGSSYRPSEINGFLVCSESVENRRSNYTVYLNGKWAEVIEYPEGCTLFQEVVGYELY